MTQDQYLTERLDDQLTFMDQKAVSNQRTYRRIRAAVIVISVLIPLLAGYTDRVPYLAVAVGVAGALIAILEGLMSLGKYYENWKEYRVTAESLEREKLYFQTGSGPYAENADAFALLVDRTEKILQAENQDWQQRIKDGSSATAAKS